MTTLPRGQGFFLPTNPETPAGEALTGIRENSMVEGRKLMHFEFRVQNEEPVQNEHSSVNSARNKAGKMAVRLNTAVDLATAGDDDYANRYITTASPSDHREAGFRFTRRKI